MKCWKIKYELNGSNCKIIEKDIPLPATSQHEYVSRQAAFDALEEIYKRHIVTIQDSLIRLKDARNEGCDLDWL